MFLVTIPMRVHVRLSRVRVQLSFGYRKMLPCEGFRPRASRYIDFISQFYLLVSYDLCFVLLHPFRVERFGIAAPFNFTASNWFKSIICMFY